MTGAMRTTATDVLEAHANLLPIALTLHNTCHRAIVRLTTHPDTHPLHGPVRRATHHFVSSHQSSLHCLTHLFSIVPNEIESLIPAHRSPSVPNPFKSHIAKTRDEAMTEQAHLKEVIQVYCEGSGFQHNIGAAAVLFRAGCQPRTLCYHLGTEDEHTVFKAEEVGLTLAAKLISTECDLHFPLSIYIDNQAAILS